MCRQAHLSVDRCSHVNNLWQGDVNVVCQHLVGLGLRCDVLKCHCLWRRVFSPHSEVCRHVMDISAAAAF